MLKNFFRSEIRIGLLIDQATPYGRGVLFGVSRFSKDHLKIAFHIEAPSEKGLSELLKWKPHGIIAMVHDPALARSIHALKIPEVHICSVDGAEPLRVQSDNNLVAQMAAQHLLQLDAETFGFVGLADTHYATERAMAFQKAIAAGGAEKCEIFMNDRSELDAWLMKQNKPLAVMSCNDTVGGHILERCLDLKLNVPEEVMIIGVDNDESVSELIRPGLSSIALDLEGIGTKATELLWKVLKGYPTDPVVLFPPKGVVVRGSTQPHPDPLLAKLIAEIQTSAINGQPLKEIIDAAPVCRMTIERRFRRLVGRTPLQEIRRVRINRAKELLGSTNLPLKAIADQSGFATPSRLIESFIRETGIRPTDYRGQRKVGASGSVKLPQSSGRCADTGKRGSTSSAKSQSTSKSTGSVKIVSLGSLDKTARYNGSTC